MKNTLIVSLPSREACPTLTFTAGSNAALELLPSATRRKVMAAAFAYIFKGELPTNLNRSALAIFALVIETSACAQSTGPFPHEQVEIPLPAVKNAAEEPQVSVTEPVEAVENEEPEQPKPPVHEFKPRNPDCLRLGRRNVKKRTVGGFPAVCRPVRRPPVSAT